MKKKLDNSVLITLVIVVGIVFLSLVWLGYLKSVSPANTISSQGISDLEVSPDIASVYFNVQTDGETGDEASEENSRIVKVLKDLIVNLGFNEEDIQTQNFNVNPKYEYPYGKQKLVGYQATHSLKVEILMEDKEKIGSVIDAGVNAGAGISYINFELTKENENKYKAESIRLATEDAKIKAEALAEGAGKRLGKVVSISTSDFGYQPWRVFSSDTGIEVMEAKAAIETDINPSDQTVSARVTAIFKIK